ncbi:hypothetical protein DL546_003823 [Coniochaeta pulveracea]|uniref:Transcription factor CBF/NF-Y/archaeal histone domain-containing protein n=1 Tax=Coniochaeta pulveracea TaxID=177199 RepID=A0A420Y043_9PEZI|nr:hypothetical protein DL546_003823 [Coniochaeta pulveracea]
MSTDDSYAPKSPELSSFSADITPQSPAQGQQLPGGYYYQQQQQQQQQPYQQRTSFSQPLMQQPHNSISAPSHSSYHPPTQPFRQYPPAVAQGGVQAPKQEAYTPQLQIQTQSLQLHQQAQVGYGPQNPATATTTTNYQQSYYQPPTTSFRNGSQQGFQQTQGYQVPQQQQQQQQFYNRAAPPGSKYSPPQQDGQSLSLSHHQDSQPQLQSHPENMPPRRSIAASGSQHATVTPSPVRTKFPTARIKRIMQADEEVGKVAQQTPIAVGKALEMFMIALVTKSAEVAKEKNSKRVTAPMLKQVVESDEQWDFLREIVSKVDAEEKKTGQKRAAKNDSDDTESEDEPAEKKKRGGRKKKV